MEISLYVHVPFCRQKCDYCDFFSIPSNRASCVCPDEEYVRSVLNEIRFYVKKYSVSRWKTVYIGGGTPSQLGAKLLFELVSGIKSAVSDKTADEFTVEMNPEDLTEDILDSAQKAGVDRISTGIQALDQKALDSVNRHCPLQTAISSLELLQKKWKKKLSVDFIAGIPGQTCSSFKKQFETVFNFKNIDHISLYSLTLEENTPLYKKIESGKIKWSQQKTDRMWILGRKILKENGFIQYEVSNFARTGAESLHNKVYWHLENYIGCGSGACGSVYGEVSERWTNTCSIKNYENFWLDFNPESEIPESIRQVEKIDLQTQEFEWIMMGFRLLEGVCSEEFKKRFGKSLEERIGVKDGLFFEWSKKHLARSYKKDGKTFYALNERGLMLLNLFLESLL
ncbi:MAG: radical SAM family heme chaperone HemW [Treponema berlinense]|uniref:radical SAM family heme chaperone HemW n=1 Tax=Treponema berlinense TaxID=225004 RepID=UPI002A7EFBC5|nr:radical SAM family heme chaperone HemW [Treponema berlinense]MDY3707623.1 radical SAM family heme chaperone HemW [Treponema berlinense]